MGILDTYVKTGSWEYEPQYKSKIEFVDDDEGFAILMQVYEGDELIGEEYYSEYDLMDSVFYLPCGCLVEPDGRCYHGINSPLIEAGVI